MDTRVATILFEIVVLLFSLSMHEAAHAWMASRLGDQTARMLGRVTLNPIKHIDPLGTLLLPLLAAATHLPLIGWAKPTPVNSRNFKNYRRDDILTIIAGPASNLLLAVAAFLLLVVMAKASPAAKEIVQSVTAQSLDLSSNTVLLPVVILLYLGMQINLLLFAFNLLPLPPLDGSQIFRHMLPYNLLRVYDSLGMVSIFLMMWFGGRWMAALIGPTLGLLNSILLNL
jgi:Zn-dependent protease